LEHQPNLLTGLFLSLCVGLSLVLSISVGLMLEAWQASFSWSPMALSFLVGSFYLVYCLIQIPAGIVVDTFGPKKIMTVGLFLAALSTFAFTVAQNYYVFLLLRVIQGIALSCNFVCFGYWVTHKISRTYQAYAFCVGESVALLFVLFINSLMLGWSHIDWRSLMQIISLLLVLFAFAAVFWAPNQYQESKTSNCWQQSIDLLGTCRGLLFQPEFMINACYAGIIGIMVSLFLPTFAIPFFSHYYHFSTSQLLYINSSILLGVIMGGPLIGLWASVAGICRLMFLAPLCIGLCCLSLVKVHYYLLHPVQLLVVLFIMGVFSSSYMLAFARAGGYVNAKARATSIGLTNGIATGLVPFLSLIIASCFNHRHQFGDAFVSVSRLDWQEMIVVMSSLFLLAFFFGYYLLRITSHCLEVKK
jgi:MFS family permease